MPLDIPMPWLRAPNTLEALSSGASAGASAARLEQEGQSESQRLGLEAMRMRQSADFESARLRQAAEQSQMEFQARNKLAEQNQLREQQRLNIENAYKTAALGIAKGRLEQQEAAAADKARAAALTFQREQAFARDVASGIPVMEAYRRNPVSSALLSSVGRTQLKTDQTSKPVIREGKYPIVRVGPTGEGEVVYTPPKPEGLSAADKEDLKDLRSERKELSARANAFLTKPEDKADLTKQISELDRRIEAIKHPAPKEPTTGTSSKDKITRAHALGIAHPDWTKEQIIDAVMKEMQ
jgi:hypothetical protein